MNAGTLVASNAAALIAVLVIIVIVALALWLYSQSRSKKLRQKFGPEYDRAVHETGNKLKAESALEKREKRIEKLHIRPLPPGDQERFAEMWRQVQTRFVDDPQQAVNDADALVGDVMSLRGYPVGDFEQRAADISVEHPRVCENYRAAHLIAMRHKRGEASTEDLRQAMVHYRTLFEDLLGT